MHDNDQTEPIRGVVFDMDGTLTVCPLDFAAMRADCGLPPCANILAEARKLSPARQAEIDRILDGHERRAAAECQLRPGALHVLNALRDRGMRLALLTNNSARSARTVTARLGLTFDVVLTREDAAPKPAPDAVLKIAERLTIAPQHLLVVGDYKFDVLAGHAAGARTAFIHTERQRTAPPETDFVLDDLHGILHIVEEARASQDSRNAP
jgi:HAD superfamily hydrolase (TIGR01509 family)